MSAKPKAAARAIVSAVIHPSIGIARVGNSPDQWFVGPEVNEPPAEAPGFYRDAHGALKRQAARFHIYGVDADGAIVAELTPHNAEIEWQVHLANKKAAWYEFQLAQDVPEAAAAPVQMLRNLPVAQRAELAIDPGARRIAGANQGGKPQYVFDSGKFMGTPVYLGELRTDAEGCLIVLGGRGVSASHDGARAVTFANNEGWHDDVSDGPVTATVRHEGRDLAVDPAWVVVAPPNYAPLQKSVRTMWDVLRDVAISSKKLPAPARPSFAQDILPLFQRLTRLQWVNAGFAANFGWGSPADFNEGHWLARLSNPSDTERDLRTNIANQFRRFERDAWAPGPWPWMYGDAMNVPPAQTPRENVTLTATQLTFLTQWAAGDFDADYDPARQPPRTLADVPLAQRGAMLDRAALEFCLADAFHPGCEMTWPMRQASMYAAPFRLLHAAPGWIEPSYGAAFSSDLLTLPGGPFFGQVPGGVTRWMAVPWQTDTASCRSGYGKIYGPYLPTFWPARVPNQVLGLDDYRVVIDDQRPLDERLAAFARRTQWLSPLLRFKDYTDQINSFVADISQMGVVEVRPGPGDAAQFPHELEVSDLGPPPKGKLLAAHAPQFESDPTPIEHIAKVHRFAHGLKN